jgi:hypothetical protein
VVNWDLKSDAGQGTFGWTAKSVTVTVPSNVRYLLPRFFGAGGGKYLVASATFAKSAQPAALPVPGALPPSARFIAYPGEGRAFRTLNSQGTVSIQMARDRSWALRPLKDPLPVLPGKTWTFTAVVAGRNVGWMNDASGWGVPAKPTAPAGLSAG